MRLRKRVQVALVLALTLLVSASVSVGCGSDSTGPKCCKVCTTGKACGDTCIATTDTCHSPPGCACNG